MDDVNKTLRATGALLQSCATNGRAPDGAPVSVEDQRRYLDSADLCCSLAGFTSLSQALAQLRGNRSARSRTSILNDHLIEIENALAAGIRRQAVIDALASAGLTFTIRGFDSALLTLRKRRAANAVTLTTEARKTQDPTDPLAAAPQSSFASRFLKHNRHDWAEIAEHFEKLAKNKRHQVLHQLLSKQEVKEHE